MVTAGKAVPIFPAPSGVNDAEQSLYEVRRKIYPRSVSGWFARWRWALVIATQWTFFVTPWLMWNGRQAVLFDLGARKFYIFGILFWPQDFIYLTVLLLISAYSLFLFTAVAGRLWCGYACPQTVYTEIFLRVERMIEGDHIARRRLDRGPLTARKIGLKSAKHVIWVLIALWTGFTFVGYFTPIKSLAGEVAHFGMGPWETFWLLFYGLATYGNAGWLREQVCKYMCPYARFQGVMFDRDTLVITYDEGRGETRGSRTKKADPRALGLGDCVDCDICVQVCPTGIDIRNGQQYECIGCAACIDSCNQVMDKMGYARGLIRYSSLNSVKEHFGWKNMLRRVFRPRVLVYTALLWTIIIAAGVTLYHRLPVKVDIIRDRATMAREIPGGLIENVYRLQIMNTEEVPREFAIGATGVDGLTVAGIAAPIAMAPAETRMFTFTLRAPADTTPRGPNRIMLHIAPVNRDQDFALHEKSIFFKP